MTTSKLTLYIGDTCRFCARVMDFIHQNPMEITIKDVWHDKTALAELVALTGRSQVPCLRMDDAFMHESLDIIEKLKSLESSS